MSKQTNIWKNGAFYQEEWVEAADAKSLKNNFILTLEEWKQGEWTSHSGKMGLSVNEKDDLKDLETALKDVDLVIVHFAGFANGTAFTLARLIRDRFGFTGEIRARGAYILDQMPLLMRCGVTSFEVSSAAVRSGLSRGAWPDLPLYYQPALDGQGYSARTELVDAKRPWLRVCKVAEQEAKKVA